MTNRELNRLYEERMNHLAPYIRTIPDEDLAQEARIGIYEALKEYPHANDFYLRQRAKWHIGTSLRKGKSVDNGFWKRDQIEILHYDPSYADDMFLFIFKNRTTIPLDQLVIDKIGSERFLAQLTEMERKIVRHKLEGCSDKKIKSKLKISDRQFGTAREEILFKIKLAFAVY